jgi:hypothetical protein
VKTFLQAAAALLLLVLAVGAAAFFYDAHLLMATADKTLKDADAEMHVQGLHAHMVLNEARATVQQLDLAAQEQREYWKKTSADSDRTVKALRLTIDRAGLLLKHTDEQLNFSLLPDADRELTFTSQQAQLAFGSIGHAGDALTFQLYDLGPIVSHLDESSEQLAVASRYFASASGHADVILLDGEKTADYYEKKLTTPASFLKKVSMGLLDVGSKAGNIMAGFVR